MPTLSVTSPNAVYSLPRKPTPRAYRWAEFLYAFALIAGPNGIATLMRYRCALRPASESRSASTLYIHARIVYRRGRTPYACVLRTVSVL